MASLQNQITDGLSDSERNLLESQRTGAKVVSAVGIAVGRQIQGVERVRIEAAMLGAVATAQRAGIKDTAEIRRLIREARDKALKNP